MAPNFPSKILGATDSWTWGLNNVVSDPEAFSREVRMIIDRAQKELGLDRLAADYLDDLLEKGREVGVVYIMFFGTQHKPVSSTGDGWYYWKRFGNTYLDDNIQECPPNEPDGEIRLELWIRFALAA